MRITKNAISLFPPESVQPLLPFRGCHPSFFLTPYWNWLAYLFLGALSGALEGIDIGLLQDNMGITATDTLDGRQRNWNGTLTVDVGAEHTKNVLELLWDHERLSENRKQN